MKVTHRIMTMAAAAAVASTPAVALAHGHPHGNHGHSPSAPGHLKTTHPRTSLPGPGASPGAKAKAYGRDCQGESKRHVAGQPGTPFSQCVTDMAQIAADAGANPHRVCANESRRHVAGARGTPYSQCVVAAAKLRGRHSRTAGSGSGS
jgi:hypothetical protein